MCVQLVFVLIYAGLSKSYILAMHFTASNLTSSYRCAFHFFLYTISFASFGYCLEVMALWLILRVISSSGFIICPRMPGYLYACWFQHQTLPRYQDVLTVLIPYMLVARSYSQCLASSIRHAYYLQSKTHTPSCHLSRLAIRVVWNVACLPTTNLLDVCICIYHSAHPWSQSHSLINIIPPYHTYCVNTDAVLDKQSSHRFDVS